MTAILNSMALAATGDDYWAEQFFGFDREQRFVVVIVVIGCVLVLAVTLAGILAGVMTTMHKRRTEESLKRDMLDRGMSADEIVKVIESARPPEDALGRLAANWCKKG
jgi:hypothetical protein